jgi:hypothetical protein
MQNQVLESVDAAGRILRLEFAWRGDRFGHSLALVPARGAEPLALAESSEGSAAEAWPPSPPLVSLSVEDLVGGRRAALLVGMAGRSHWSASALALPREGAFLFDVACRPGAAPAALTSTYELTAAGRHCLQVEADESVGGQMEIAASRLVVSAREQDLQAGKTVRWKYRIALGPR